MDLVLLHQSQIKNTLATSGTALTESHLKRLQKLSNRLIIAYDSDEAGKSAARRSGELALSLGMEVKIVSLPLGEDPASIIQKSADRWKEMLKSSANLVEFAVDECLRKSASVAYGGRGRSGVLVREFSRSVLPLLCSIQSEMMRSEMVALSSRKTNISEKSIWDDIERAKKNIKNTDFNGANSSVEPITLTPEEMLSGIILLRTDVKNDEIRKKMEELVGEPAVSDIILNGRFDKNTLIFETEARLAGMDIEKAAQELLSRMEKGLLEKELFEAAHSLDASSNVLEKEMLKKKTGEISKRIALLDKK
jgi:DNA primase